MKYNLLPLAFAFLSTATLALGLFITFEKLHAQSNAIVSVSYTHLTLPTICSV